MARRIPSRMDRVHDEFIPGKVKKAGTKYERLVAVVRKLAERTSVVIHDIKLRGETGVAHQIDVTVERRGRPYRILFECKDFDKGDGVGLDIVRDFFGVVDDVKPDDAFIVTTSGFTEPAQLYAKGKGIRLCKLRELGPDEWTRRFRTFMLQRSCFRLALMEHRIVFKRMDEARDFQRACARKDIEASTGQVVTIRGLTFDTPVVAHVSGHRGVQLAEFLGNEMVACAAPEPGGGPHVLVVEVPYTSLTLQVETFFASVASIQYTVSVSPEEERHLLVGDAVASLIWEELHSDDQMLIYGNQLDRYVFNEKGEVVEAPERAPKEKPERVGPFPEGWTAPPAPWAAAPTKPGRVHRPPKAR